MGRPNGAIMIPHAGLDTVDSSKKLPLGALVEDEYGNVYKYLKGVASTVVGSVVNYYGDGTTKLLTEAETAKGYPLAIAQAAIVADKYGFYLVAGNVATSKAALIKSKASTAAESVLYADADTAGQVDDAGTTKIQGLILPTATGAAATTNATGLVNWPTPVL